MIPDRSHTLPDEPSIRGEYASRGVEAFYRDAGSTYRNPHEPIIRRVLQTVVNRWNLDVTQVLDLSAGSGEVTMALRELGARQIEACDPYTQQAYLSRTGQIAEGWSFENIAAGVLNGRRYSLITCSFALHLCEPSRLPAVAQALAAASAHLLILTPHKRPAVRPEWGWQIEQETVMERVRARLYRALVEPA